MASVLGPEQLEAVSKLFRVLGEPTRLALLQCLKDGPRSVGEMVDELAARQANVSKQLGLLYESGLLTRERKGNQIYYEIADPLVFELCDMVCGKLRRDAARQLKALNGTGRR